MLQSVVLWCIQVHQEVVECLAHSEGCNEVKDSFCIDWCCDVVAFEEVILTLVACSIVRGCFVMISVHSDKLGLDSCMEIIYIDFGSVC